MMVRKPNRLIDAGYKLTLRGQRLLCLAFTKINIVHYLFGTPDGIEISANEWQSLFDDGENPPENAYRDIKHGANSILAAKVYFRDGEVHQILDEVVFEKGSGKVVLKFSYGFLAACTDMSIVDLTNKAIN